MSAATTSPPPVPEHWDDRRGWAYLVWLGHLQREGRRHPGAIHSSDGCDACMLANMLGLTALDGERLHGDPQTSSEASVETDDSGATVIQLPVRGKCH